jgi:toxin ParE1/3/4
MGRIHRSPQSKVDYLEIWLYVADQSQSAAVADELTNTFDRKLELLSDYPGLGRRRADIGDSVRQFPVGSYLIFYRPIRGGIELIRLVHGSRDLRRLFRK